MNQTVVGYFDSRGQARTACSQLQAAGFPAQISDGAPLDAAHPTSELTVRTEADNDVGVLAHIRHFFSDVFGESHEHLSRYEEGVRRGGCVVKVPVSSDEQLAGATGILEGAGAADIDERSSQWSDKASTGAVERGGVRVYDRKL